MNKTVDARQFRQALGSFATGVTIVTTRDASGQDIGLTANSFNSVSIDPPLVLWSLARKAKSHPAFSEAKYFAVHILASDQESLSTRFATSGADKFGGLVVGRGAGEVPLLNGCAARFVCRTTYRYEGGDHEIFVGEVTDFEHFDRAPLIFQKGKYAIAVNKVTAGSQEWSGDFSADFRKNFLSYLVGFAHSLLMQRILPAIKGRGLEESEYFVLAALGMEDGRNSAELDQLLQITSRRVTTELLRGLGDKALIRIEGNKVFLTESGRKMLIELVSLSKAVEEDALRDIDYSEVALMKQNLRQLIRTSLADS